MLQQTPAGDQQTAQQHVVRSLSTQLFEELVEPLRAVARGWLHSDLGRDVTQARYLGAGGSDHTAVQVLAESMFLYILEALPTLVVRDPYRLSQYLQQIARHGLYDEDYKMYRGYAAPRRGRRPPTFVRLRAPHHTEECELELQEPADPTTLEADELLIRALDHEHCLALVYAFWEQLSPRDGFIVQARWRREPRLSFEQIAIELGPGWTVEAVRQRYTRAMKRTRTHLQSLGWNGD